jgi:hypothetical protein
MRLFMMGAIVLAVAVGAGTARADDVAITFGSGITNYTQGSFLEGFEFTAQSAISITKLGAYDSNLNPIAVNPRSESFADELVGVYDLTTSTLLGSATVTASDSETAGDFRYASLNTPIALNTTDDYVIVAITNGNYYNCCTTETDVTVNPDIAIDYSSNFVVTSSNNIYGYGQWFLTDGLPSASTSSFKFMNWSPDFADLGPNFQFTAGGATPSAVPEPTSLLLLSTGLGGMALAAGRKKK